MGGGGAGVCGLQGYLTPLMPGEQAWALSCRQWAPWEVLNKGGGLNILEGYAGDSEENALQGEAGGREVGKGAAVAVHTLADAEGGGRVGRKGEMDAG